MYTFIFSQVVWMSQAHGLCRHGHTGLDCVHLVGNATLVSTSCFAREHPETFYERLKTVRKMKRSDFIKLIHWS